MTRFSSEMPPCSYQRSHLSQHQLKNELVCEKWQPGGTGEPLQMFKAPFEAGYIPRKVLGGAPGKVVNTNRGGEIVAAGDEIPGAQEEEPCPIQIKPFSFAPLDYSSGEGSTTPTSPGSNVAFKNSSSTPIPKWEQESNVRDLVTAFELSQEAKYMPSIETTDFAIRCQDPRQAYLKEIVNYQLRSKLSEVRRESEEHSEKDSTDDEEYECSSEGPLQDDLRTHFIRMEINSEIRKIGRLRARRQQIKKLLTYRADKRALLKELREKSILEKLKQLKLQRGKLILDLAAVNQQERRDELITTRLKTRLQEALQEDLTQSLTASYQNEELKVIVDKRLDGFNKVIRHKKLNYSQYDPTATAVHSQEPSRVPRSDSGNWFGQYSLRVGVDNKNRSSSVSSETVIESPGPKEFFLRTIVNNILSKRSNKGSRTRQMFLLSRHIAMPEQAYLKLKVIKKIKRAKERQRMWTVRRLINSEITTYGNKAAVAREIARKSEEIKRRVGLLSKLEMELREEREVRKRTLTKDLNELKLQRGRVITELGRFASSINSTKEQELKQAVREVTKQRARKTLVCHEIKNRRLEYARKQEAKAHRLKREINTIVETHFRLSQVVLDIKTRGQTIFNKEKVLEQLRIRSSKIAKRKAWLNFSWREQRERLHDDLARHIEAKRQQKREEEIRLHPIKRYDDRPVARQMFLKKEVNIQIRQRGRKLAMQRELLTRFRTVDLKTELCQEIHERVHRQAWRRELIKREITMVVNQRALKAQVNLWIRKQNWRLRSVSTKKALKKTTSFSLDDNFSTAKKKNKDQLKTEIGKEVEKVNLRARLRKLKERRGSVILELSKVQNKQIRLKRRLMQEIRNKTMSENMLKVLKERAEAKKRKHQIDQVLRQRELKTRLNREIHQRQRQTTMKKLVLQELRMVKLKMMVGREIKQRAEIARNKRAVYQDLQARFDKATAMRQIKNKDHWILNPRYRMEQARQAWHYARVVEQVNLMGKRMRVNEEIRHLNEMARRRKHIAVIMAQCKRKDACLKEMQNLSETKLDTDQCVESKVKCIKEKVKKMLRLRAQVVRRKSLVNMELKMRVAKAKCVFAIWKRAQSRMFHSYVIQELKQRTNLARCVQKIKTRDFYPRHVAWPVEISPLVGVKQHINHKKVITVIKQAGRKIALNNEILQRQAQCNQKEMVLTEIKCRFARTKINEEIRAKGRLVLRVGVAKKVEVIDYHKLVVIEFKQRWRHAEVMQEIRVRQKQIFWKQQTCIIIKQGGHKVRVNKEIRSIARQKCIKKQINTLIKQGGMRSRLMKEIRQLKMVSELKKQKELKAKVNLTIRQMAKAVENKRKVCAVIKQTGLKAICNRQIRRKHFRLRSWSVPIIIKQQASDRSQRYQQPAQQVPSVVQFGVQCEKLEHLQITRPKINTNRRRRHGSFMQEQLQKLADQLEKHNEKQEGQIRSLAAEVRQQKADFNALVSRMVDDKNKLYQELDVLMRENQILKNNVNEKRKLMVMQKSQVQVVGKTIGSNRHRQLQQTPIFYQEMQEMGKSRVATNAGRGKMQYNHQLNTQAQQVEHMTQILL
jgi:hypothetical protein